MNFLRNKFLPNFLLLCLLSQSVYAIDVPGQKQLNQLLKGAQSKGSPVSIQAYPLNQRSPSAEKPFTRQQAVEIGIPRVNVLTPDEFIPPYWNGRGIASGDVNKDGYVDIAIATKMGMQLYLNDNGKKFKRVNLKLPVIDKLDVFIVALVDINNDSWLDIFLTSYRSGNYTMLNEKGSFSEKALVKVPASPLVLTKSLTFGDVDRDGDVDAVLGNWFYGYLKHFPPADSDNKLLINEKGMFTPKLIEGIAGEDGLHPIQQQFLEHAALQCGICTPGFIVATKALLDRTPDPDEETIRYWLAGNLCRCTGYDKIIRAVQGAAKQLAQEA